MLRRPVKRRAEARGRRASNVTLSAAALEAAALRYLAGRDRTEAQLRAYLLRRGASSTALRRVIGRLQDYGYVNDQAFAQRWAESRLAQRPMGRQRLEAELLNRGVAPLLAAGVLNDCYAQVDEAELARRLLTQRTRMQQRVGPLKPAQAADRRFAQMAGLLRRYGFANDTIEAVLNEGPDGLDEISRGTDRRS